MTEVQVENHGAHIYTRFGPGFAKLFDQAGSADQGPGLLLGSLIADSVDGSETVTENGKMYSRNTQLLLSASAAPAKAAAAHPQVWRDITIPFGAGDGTFRLQQRIVKDPNLTWQLYDGALRNVIVVGTEVLHGVQTTHVSGTIDSATFLANLTRLDPSIDPAALDQQTLQSIGLTTQAVEYWIDDSGLIQQIQSISKSSAEPMVATVGYGPLSIPDVKLGEPPTNYGGTVATENGFGAISIGMTRQQALAVQGTTTSASTPACAAIDFRTKLGVNQVLVGRKDGKVDSIATAAGTVTDRGVGDGSTADAVIAAYSGDRHVKKAYSEAGQVVVVTSGDPDAVLHGQLGVPVLGFSVGDDGTVGPPVIGSVPGIENCSG